MDKIDTNIGHEGAVPKKIANRMGLIWSIALLTAMLSVSENARAAIGESNKKSPIVAPNISPEPAGSIILKSVAWHEAAIRDMLALNNPNRASIDAAIKKLDDGGSTEELQSLYIWAKIIADNESAPPAARQEARAILSDLQPSEDTGEKSQEQENWTEQRQWWDQKTVDKPRLPPLNESDAEKKERIKKEKTIKDVNDFLSDPKNGLPGKDNSVVIEIKSIAGQMIFIVKKGGKIKGTTLPTGYVNFNYGINRQFHLIPDQEYSFKLHKAKDLKPWEEPIDKTRLIFFDKNWTRLNLSWEPDPTFTLQLQSDTDIPVKIPKWCSCVSTRVDFWLESDGASKRYIMGRLEVVEKK